MDIDRLPTNQVRQLNWEEVSKLPPLMRLALCALQDGSAPLNLLRGAYPNWFVPENESGLSIAAVREIARLQAINWENTDELVDVDGATLDLFAQDIALALFFDDGMECNLHHLAELLSEVAHALNGRRARWGMMVDTTEGRFLVGNVEMKTSSGEGRDVAVKLDETIRGGDLVRAFLYPAASIAELSLDAALS